MPLSIEVIPEGDSYVPNVFMKICLYVQSGREKYTICSFVRDGTSFFNPPNPGSSSHAAGKIPVIATFRVLTFIGKEVLEDSSRLLFFFFFSSWILPVNTDRQTLRAILSYLRRERNFWEKEKRKNNTNRLTSITIKILIALIVNAFRTSLENYPS